jgi:hypothetical protein
MTQNTRRWDPKICHAGELIVPENFENSNINSLTIDTDTIESRFLAVSEIFFRILIFLKELHFDDIVIDITASFVTKSVMTPTAIPVWCEDNSHFGIRQVNAIPFKSTFFST